MLFNSIDFLVFIICLFAILFIFKKNEQQKWIYLIASYVFYMWWNPALILLLIFSTTLNYFVGKFIANNLDNIYGKRWLIVGIIINLGMLGFFKYDIFFENSFNFISGTSHHSWVSQHIVLPVGISFYTFQALSYIIDIYHKKIKPVQSPLDFFVYKSFFPQLVAGPIVRASDFLPQLQKERKIRFETIPVLLVLKGLFKKIVIADNLGMFTDAVYAKPENYPSLIIWIATISFTIQIYCDFSGYTDIAIGIAKILGFDFPKNFNKPYFALTISDFWKRWHISLSSWLRDYLYIPLGGNKISNLITYRNLMITMLLGGLWHGASWNFVIWGGLHGALLCINRWLKVDAIIFNSKSKIVKIFSWFITLFLVNILWVIFRIADIGKLKIVLGKFFLFDFNFHISDIGIGNLYLFSNLSLIIAFAGIHFYSYRKNEIENVFSTFNNSILFMLIFLATVVCYFFLPSKEVPFIYFQF